jgi:hypothetical protein
MAACLLLLARALADMSTRMHGSTRTDGAADAGPSLGTTGGARTCSAGVTIALLAAAAAPVAGQCTLQSQAGYGFPGVAGHVTALVPWDPDGVGPLPWHVVLGGAFVHAGTVDATHLAAWNPANGAWLALPAAPGGAVTALAAQPTGELVVALEVWQSGPTPVARIVAWNGVAWTVLGPDFDAPVRALHVRPNGQLVAAGSFTPAGGGASLGGVVAWNGAVWSSVGGGIPGEVATLATMPNGDLLAGGTFPSAGGVAATNVARWNGTAWSALGGGTTSPVTALVPAGSSRVFAGTMSDLVEWNGTSWAVVPGLNAGWTLMPSISALTLLQGQASPRSIWVPARGRRSARASSRGTRAMPCSSCPAAGCSSPARSIAPACSTSARRHGGTAPLGAP